MRLLFFVVSAAVFVCSPLVSQAQTGVSDDRISLPEGPGSLEGIGENVDLDENMGVMRYGVSIQTPAGFQGVSPELRLAYSSGNGSSVVGMGWMMHIPSIERMTYRKLPRYTRDDDFCVGGGTQLVELPSSSPPTYHARYEKEFVRYQWHGADDGAQGYWTAEYPDGRIGYFGATQEGALVDAARVYGDEGTFRYMLVDMVDVYGHKATYSYEKFGNSALVRHIGYVFVSEDAGLRYSVSFAYEERMDDTGFDYLSNAKAGFDERLTQRLKTISVFSENTRIRRYALTYEPYAESGGFTRLRNIQMFGLDNEPYPAAHTFTYSQALGGICDDCERPFVVDMGNIGVNIGVGRATLLDINGDALPDIINTTNDGPHQFILNIPDASGTSRFNVTPTSSQVGSGSGFRLGTPYVQILDTNGDGFTDMFHAQSGRTLLNKGNGDWEMMVDAQGAESVRDAFGADFDIGEGELRTIRFLDYNNDKKIDVVRSTRSTTSIFQNLGSQGFEEDDNVELLGYGIQADRIQFTDMNGDGLLDPVKLSLGGLRYRINLGWGRWGEEVEILGLPLGESELSNSSLEDLNGDGLADLVVVSGREVKYAINRNGRTLSEVTTLMSNHVDGEIPLRDGTITVLFADMNGNGSTDIVWLTSEGQVDYLELFPVRPNQLARIENNLGMVTDITYSTSVQQMALDAETELWRYTLPHPMLVVESIDQYDLLTDVHNITRYRYHNGFYDGEEKQFRGFERVDRLTEGDESQEEGWTTSTFDVGAEDTYYNGLLLTQSILSDGRALNQVEHRYQECPLDNIPENTDLSIRFICKTETQRILKEGTEESRWVTTQTHMAYDGYGNVTRYEDRGVTSIGGNGCEPCERDPSQFGKPCGEQCLGDEHYKETTFVSPENTAGRWILRAPYRTRHYGRAGSTFVSEKMLYYDGEPFVGLPTGQLTQGKLVRETHNVNLGSSDVIQTVRNAHDAHGNVIETIDPNGVVGGNTHRRTYLYDDDFLRVMQVDVHLEDPQEQPYILRQRLRYERLFDKVEESSGWMRIVDNANQSPTKSAYYMYDTFGRLTQRLLAGETDLERPTETYTYALGNPVSQILVHSRSETDGSIDLEDIRCHDGRGRVFQSRKRLGPDRYQVNGFTLFNLRSSPIRKYEPYISASSACDMAVPEGVRFVQSRYDATERLIEEITPDAEEYGTSSVTRTLFEPLVSIAHDGEDTDPDSPHYNTPQARETDGLGRLVSLKRHLTPEQSEGLVFNYDELGRLQGYVDAQGNEKRQQHDLLGRITAMFDPNTTDTTTVEYDAVGNAIRHHDPRGITTRSTYDGLNRITTRWDEADPDNTRIAWFYDTTPPACNPAQCSNVEGMIAQITYPLGSDGQRGTEQFGYDIRSRLFYTARELDDVRFETYQHHDNANRITGITYPDGQTLDFDYDAASRLTEIAGVVHTITYDDRGQMTYMGCADGSATSREYDALMRPSRMMTTDQGGKVLQGFDYTRNRVGNILAIDDLAESSPTTPSATTRYSYDAWYRLTEARFGTEEDDEVLNYSYNTIDNVLSATSSWGADSPAHQGELSYDPDRPNAVAQTANLMLGYDPSGNTNQRGQQTLSWDFMGRLTAVADTHTNQFMYGAGEKRVKKVEDDSVTYYISPDYEVRDGISTLFVRHGQARLARIESDGLAAQILSDIAPIDAPDGKITAGDAWVAMARRDNLLEGEEGSAPGSLLWSSVRRLLIETGEGTTYLHHNHLGSITLATEGDSKVVGRQAFYPTGAQRSKTGDIDNYGFTGQEHDSTGLIYFGFRYLDSETGRWASIDPKFRASSTKNINTPADFSTGYAYVSNNAINNVDREGLLTDAEINGVVQTILRDVPASRTGAPAGATSGTQAKRNILIAEVTYSNGNTSYHYALSNKANQKLMSRFDVTLDSGKTFEHIVGVLDTSALVTTAQNPAFPRNFDTEAVFFTFIKDKAASDGLGMKNVDMYSVREPCTSCRKVMDVFHRKYAVAARPKLKARHDDGSASLQITKDIKSEKRSAAEQATSAQTGKAKRVRLTK